MHTKKQNGSITIYLSLILTVILALICTIIESARVYVINAKADGVSYIAAESVFGEYVREVFDDYGIMMYWNENGIEENLEQYINANIRLNETSVVNNTDLYGIYLNGVELLESDRVTDNNGYDLLEQINSYMKYKSIEEGVDRLLKQFNIYEEESEEDSTSEQIEAMTATDTEIFSVAEMMTDQLEEFDSLVSDGKKLFEKASETDIDTDKFEKRFNKIIKNIKELKEMCSDILLTCDTYEAERESYCSQNGSMAEELLNDNSVVEIAAAISEVEGLINQVLNEDGSYEVQMEIIEDIYDKAENINITKNGTSEGETNPSELLQYVKDVINNGILGVVTENPGDISDAVVNTDELPSIVCEYDTKTNESDSDSATLSDKALYTYYLSLHFGNYTDIKENTALKYEIEYILSGCSSDRENLTKSIEKIIAIREAFNIAYLFTDSVKRNEAYEVAVAFTGALGLPALSIIAQGIILAAWALAESIVDIRILLKGEKVPIIKTGDTWNLDLSGVASIGEDISGADGGSSSGLTYENYIQLLMMIQNQTVSLYRTMDLIQLNMQSTYNRNFKISDCIFNYSFNAEYCADSVFVTIPLVKNVLGITGNEYIIEKEFAVGY